MRKKIIKIVDLNMTYHTCNQEIQTLSNINFSVYDKEFLSITGPSGCGKSTILSLIAGLLKPTKGKIFVDSQKVEGIIPKIGYMLQNDHLLPWKNVEKNTYLGLEIRNELTKENKDFALELLNKYGLKNFLNSKPSNLSGGMRQKVSLIRTLALNPQILLLDEPFSALDFNSRINIADEIKEIITKENKTAILITHDIQEAISLSDKVIVLSKRPAKIKNIINIEIPHGNSLERRRSDKFNSYFEKIWKGIEKNE